MTELFPPANGPRAFALPPGVDFSRALVAGLDARLAGQPPDAAARVTIWVNTRRAGRSLTEAFMGSGPRLLPRIRVIGDLASDPGLPVALAPAAPPLRRKLELARLVARLLEAAPDLASGTAAFDLADSLADLLDEMRGEGIPLAALRGIDPEGHAAHWQRSLQFLDLLTAYEAATGPGGAAEGAAEGASGGAAAGGQARLRAAAEALDRIWSAAPPRDPMIVAGSTGSRGGTRAFMALVARQPQGALILPGFDTALPAPVWARLDPGPQGGEGNGGDHPQAAYRKLAAAVGFAPGSLPLWHDAPPPSPERNALVSLALRPAPVTDQWRSEGRALAGSLGRAMENVTWIEAADPRGEARAIAWLLREAAEEGRRAALVTPDRMLARRVTAELGRWRLIPDDSAGRPLGLTPPGVLLRLAAEAAGRPLAPATLLALLKHPLTNSAPGARRGHMALTDRLEREHLRGGAPAIGWPALAEWAAKPRSEDGAPAWAAWLETALAPLADPAPLPLPEMTRRHRHAVETLAAGPDGADTHALWQRDAGAAAKAMMDELDAEAPAYGAITPAEYRALLQSQMAGRDVPEEAPVTHAGVAIWGTLEARVQSADLVILGGLTEGTWPGQPGADPWLSRPLRKAIGLPLPERRTGLAAHDFQQAIGAKRVVLARAARDTEAPAVATRWLLRLENLLTGLGPEGLSALEDAKSRGNAILARAARLDATEDRVPPAPRPSPRPPRDALPPALSVTRLETLIRDPYAIYARHVLGLRPLDPPGRAADALARGNAIHAALDAFVAKTVEGLPEDPRPAFEQAVTAALEENAPWPAIRAIWHARILRSADWFIAGERERRARARPAAREISGRRALTGTPAPFAVTARVDRIDVTPGGHLAIYDYKSGHLPSAPEAKAFHLQLPLEAAIAEAGGFDGLAPARAEWLELIGLGGQQSVVLDAAPEAIAETWARLAELITAYQRATTGFTARLRHRRITYASDYDHLSRFGEWADGDPVEETP